MIATVHTLGHPAYTQGSRCEFDADLIRRLDRNGPRYTSYPSADRFVDSFDAGAYRAHLENYGTGAVVRPLSLYVHIPFCSTVCFYCGCNKVITRNRARAVQYLGYLQRETAMHSELLSRWARVEQLHLGGGTPTYLRPEQLAELMKTLRGRFEFAPSFEGSIEVDPRSVDADTIAALGELGFNRLSMGVQDFDPQVQHAINRVQSEEQTADTLDTARTHGFRSINVDLIYGLPKQTLTSIRETLDKVIALRADRIAFYNYAHLPALFKTQRKILEADLPSPETKLQMLGEAIRRMSAAGYVHIGMDHFALPSDELAKAQRHGRLHRNFQGYSTHAECDLLGLGASAIGVFGPAYYQNMRALEPYYERLERGELPIMRGLQMSRDDLVRRCVIQALICHFEVCKESVESAWLLDFDRYFETELSELHALEREGLLEIGDAWINVTPRGRLLIRSICMVFDRHLRADQERRRYSKVI
jgi:oxygen-independent coproporphyrinogen-3 oxidase